MIKNTSLATDDWNAAAVPCNAVVKLIGRATSFSAFWIASTAAPSEMPGAVLKETVVAGNCPKCVTRSGPVCCSTCTNADSGTWPLVADDDDGRYIFDRVSSDFC